MCPTPSCWFLTWVVVCAVALPVTAQPAGCPRVTAPALLDLGVVEQGSTGSISFEALALATNDAPITITGVSRGFEGGVVLGPPLPVELSPGADVQFTYQLTPADNRLSESVIRLVTDPPCGGFEIGVRVEVSGPPRCAMRPPIRPAAGVPCEFGVEANLDPQGIASYGWWFDDGSVASGALIARVFETPDVYRVRLCVTDAEGYTTCCTRHIGVREALTCVIEPNSIDIDAGMPLELTVESNAEASDVLVWEFGDGHMGDGTVVSHVYEGAGTYNASVCIRNADGSIEYCCADVEVTVRNPEIYGEHVRVVDTELVDGITALAPIGDSVGVFGLDGLVSMAVQNGVLTRVDTSALPDVFEAVAVDGGLLYGVSAAGTIYALSAAGLDVLGSIAPTARPDSGELAATAGFIYFVADEIVYGVDAREPASMAVAGPVEGAGGFSPSIAADAGRLYVANANGSMGVAVYDVSQPEQPKRLALYEYDDLGYIHEMHAAGGRLYAVGVTATTGSPPCRDCERSTLIQFDLNEPDAYSHEVLGRDEHISLPAVLGTQIYYIAESLLAHSVGPPVVYGGAAPFRSAATRLYAASGGLIAAGENWVEWIPQPDLPPMRSVPVVTEGGSLALASRQQFAFQSTESGVEPHYEHRSWTIDLQSGQKSSRPLDFPIGAIAWQGGIAFQRSGSLGPGSALSVFSTADPQTPELLGRVLLAGAEQLAVAVLGEVAVVNDAAGFAAYDVANPRDPHPAWHVDLPGVRQLRTSEGVLYVLTASGLSRYAADLNDAVWIDQWSSSPATVVKRFDVDGNIAIASSKDRLHVVEFGNGPPRELAQLAVVGANDVNYEAGEVAVTTASGVALIDARVPTAPQRVGDVGTLDPVVHLARSDLGAVVIGTRGTRLQFDGASQVVGRLLLAPSGAILSDVEQQIEMLSPSRAGARLAVGQVFPNPARPADGLDLIFVLPSAGTATAHVYDATGRSVRLLVDSAVEAGRHRLVWDGRLANGGRAPSGVYFLRIAAGDEIATRRLVLVQ